MPIDRDAPFRHREIRTPAIVASRYWPSDKPPVQLYCSEVIGAVDDKDAAECVAARPNIRRVTMAAADSLGDG